MKRAHFLPKAFLAAAALIVAAQAGAVTVVDCPFKGAGDALTRGFYVDNVDAVTLSTVTLGHAAAAPGERTIALTARLSAYNGGILGVATVTRTIGPTMTASTFDFGHVRIPPNQTIAFTQAVVAGDPAVTYDRGQGSCDKVVQTSDTAPPLSEFIRDAVGLMITGSPPDDSTNTTLSCPLDPAETGEPVSHAFYVTNYGGTRLNTVSLFHRAAQQGTRRIRLTARLGGIEGPTIATASVERFMNSTRSESLFDLGNLPVAAGSTIVFTQEVVQGNTTVTHDVGFGPCADVVQTDVTPPGGATAAVVKAVVRESVGLKITGRVATATPITVIEYFHGGFGHYFMTADPAEIAGLDGGAYGGVFSRTGQTFKARDGPAIGAIPVCRFFTVAFAPKSSHFYTANPPECGGLKANPNWQYEKIAFYNAVPNLAGVCPQDTVPVYRVYNNGQTGAPNHRFTTSIAIHDDFVQNRGWVSEGVRFCAPL
jgi:serine protease